MSYKDQHAVQDVNGRHCTAKNVATVGSHQSSHLLHSSDPSCRPQHSLETQFHCNQQTLNYSAAGHANGLSCPDIHNGIIGSGQQQHLLSQGALFSFSLPVSSSEGAGKYPILATALASLPASSHNQLSSNNNKMTVTTILNQLEQNHPSQSQTLQCNGDDHLSLASGRIWATDDSASKQFFYDGNSRQGISFRPGIESASVTNYQLSSRIHNSIDSSSESDAGIQHQNVAMIFDMDSKSIRHVSSAVPMAPLSLIHSTQMQPAGFVSPLNSAHVGNRMNSSTCYPTFYLPRAKSLLPPVLRSTDYGGTMTAARDRWHEQRPQPQSDRFSGVHQPFSTAMYWNLQPLACTAVKLVSTGACSSEAVKCESQVGGGLQMWTANGIPASAALPLSVTGGQSLYQAQSDLHHQRLGIRQQNSISHRQRHGSHSVQKIGGESNWLHSSHFGAVHSNCDSQNAARNVSSFDNSKKCEDVQHSATFHVLDLSSSSQLHVGSDARFRLPCVSAATVPSVNSATMINSNALPSHPPHYRHYQHQQQQHQTLNVKEEPSGEMRAAGDEAEKLLNRLKCNLIEEVPRCHCRGSSYDESVEGPYYTHLGVAPTEAAIRQLMERRLGVSGVALRIEKLLFTGKEGKSAQGCPIAKWILRRSGPAEQVLVLTRRRHGHHCQHAVMVVGVCVWDALEQNYATELYDYLCQVLPDNAEPTERRCGWNDRKTCACQGWNESTGGASFSFGCSWSMYYNACKFARSDCPRKFRLKDRCEESKLDQCLQTLATHVAPLYERVAPQSYYNQVHFESEGSSCRIGYNVGGRPWSGVTAVVDFCTHSHKDSNNMNNGCTTVLTLTKHRGFERPSEEQLHVLPLCVLDSTDEHGSVEGQRRKVAYGSVECLRAYPLTTRLHRQPVMCKRKRLKLAALARRGKSSLGVAAANVLRAAAHCRMSSGGRGRGGPKHQRRFGARYHQMPVATGSAGDADQTTAGFQSHAQSGPLRYATPDPRTLSENTSLSQSYTPASLRRELHAGNSNVPNAWSQFNSHHLHADAVGRQGSEQHWLSSGAPFRAGNSAWQWEVRHQNSGIWNQWPVTYNRHEPRRGAMALDSTGQYRVPDGCSAADVPQCCTTSPRPARPLRLDQMSVVEPAVQRPSSQNSTAAAPVVTRLDLGGHQQRGTAVTCESPMADRAARSRSSDEQLCRFRFLEMLSDVADRQPKLPEVGSVSGCGQLGHVGGGQSGQLDHELERAPAPPPPPLEIFSDNASSFGDASLGGVALALTHGSVLFEVAKRELHATTALKNPDRAQPTRISLVFYQHRNLNAVNHGRRTFDERVRLKRGRTAVDALNGCGDVRDEVNRSGPQSDLTTVDERESAAAGGGFGSGFGAVTGWNDSTTELSTPHHVPTVDELTQLDLTQL